jgi:hypothetical protein
MTDHEDRFIPPKGDDAQPRASYIELWVRQAPPIRVLPASALADSLRGAPGGPANPNGTSESPPPADRWVTGYREARRGGGWAHGYSPRELSTVSPGGQTDSSPEGTTLSLGEAGHTRAET